MKERNLGIDILRIMSMFLIVMLHILTHGKVYNNISHGVLTTEFFKFIRVICFSAVNIYALISGYVGLNKKVSVKRIVGLYLQVWFISFIITFIYSILTRDFNVVYFVKSIFPVFLNQYWYFTSYFALIFIMPILNTAVNSFSKRQAVITCLCCFFLFSFFDSVNAISVFGVSGGYSFVWISFLYFLGAIIKKHNFECELTKGKIVFLLILIHILLYFGGYIVDLISTVFQFKIPQDYLLKYNSPLVVIIAILWMFFFLKIPFAAIRSNIKNIVLNISKTTFGIYLIHDHPLVREYIFQGVINRVINFNRMPILNFFIITIIVFCVCSFLEMFRQKIFEILRIELLSKCIERNFNKISLKMMDRKCD